MTNEAPGGGTVDNAVTGSGGGGTPPICGGDCSVAVNVAAAVIDVNKTSDPASGTELEVGQMVHYTLTATVANAALNADLLLSDTPAPGLTMGTLPSGCSAAARRSPASSRPARNRAYTFTYAATIRRTRSSTMK